MGGFGSGRYGGRTTVETSLTLDINRLLRQSLIVPGAHNFGTLTWTNHATGEDVASIGFEASLVDYRDAWARFQYSANEMPQDFTVWIDNSRCHYGGLRWWWRCPRSGRRVAKLCLPPGASIFASRSFYRLAYNSQRVTTLDRSHNRQRRLYRKLGAEYEDFEQTPPRRPKGMHRRTYERLTAELYDAMEAHDEIFEIGAAAILARLMKLDTRGL